VLGLSEGGLGGQDAPDGFPTSGRNAYPPGANPFFADAPCQCRRYIIDTRETEGLHFLTSRLQHERK